MNENPWLRVLNSCSDNRKSNIQNRKWVGCLAILVMLAGWVRMAEAQQPKKVPRIGFLLGGSPSSASPFTEAFRQGLRELGYVEGKNIVIEYRWTEGKTERLPDLAAELVRLKVDVIVVGATTQTAAAKKATNTIPIVMAGVGDPIGAGFIASLSRPGGNVTGVTTLMAELSGKRLELLKEAVPKLFRVAALFSPTGLGPLQLKEVEVAAKSLGLKVQSLEVQAPEDLEPAFSAMKRERSNGLIALRGAIINFQGRQVVDLAAKNRMPAIYYDKEFVESGGLMAYGPSIADQSRRAAIYVDKILKGAKPADLPVEQPMKFELVINLKTAKQIGLTIPQSVLYRADKVIK